MYYSYQNQPARIWKNRLKGQPTSCFFIDPNLKSVFFILLFVELFSFRIILLRLFETHYKLRS